MELKVHSVSCQMVLSHVCASVHTVGSLIEAFFFYKLILFSNLYHTTTKLIILASLSRNTMQLWDSNKI
jgi:hypothetical protein